MRTYTIVVEPDEDGGYFVTVPAPECESPRQRMSTPIGSGAA